MVINPTAVSTRRPIRVSILIDKCKLAATGMSARNPNRNLLMNVASALDQLTDRLADLEKRLGIESNDEEEMK